MPDQPQPAEDRFRLLPGDEEGVARDIDFCFELGDYDTARRQLHRLIELLSREQLLIGKIRNAWERYEAALANREHGAVAANDFIFAVQDALAAVKAEETTNE